VEVLTGRCDAAVAESLLDDLKVGAAGEQPRGMRVAQVVKSRPRIKAGGGARGAPDVVAEPVAWQGPSVSRVRTHAANRDSWLAARRGSSRTRHGSGRSGTGRPCTPRACRECTGGRRRSAR